MGLVVLRRRRADERGLAGRRCPHGGHQHRTGVASREKIADLRGSPPGVSTRDNVRCVDAGPRAWSSPRSLRRDSGTPPRSGPICPCLAPSGSCTRTWWHWLNAGSGPAYCTRVGVYW